MILSLLLLTNIVYFDTSCLVTLYDIIFFWTQAPDIPIWKIATSITVRVLEVNKYTIDQYTITDIYILVKDIQGQKVITHI